MPDHPNVWTDGSLVLDRVTGISASGAGFFSYSPKDCWRGSQWELVDDVCLDGVRRSCRGFCSVLGPPQSVQRAEMWGVILALQSSSAVHLGVHNLGVVRHVGRLLADCPGTTPFEPVNDGDLLFFTDRMLHLRGRDTVRITKVKGHADEGMVLDGRVRELDSFGNCAADDAADFGRRRVSDAVIDVRRNLSGGCVRFYPVILDLHRFFIAIARALVNHDGLGGTAPDPPVWSAGALHKRRRLVHAVRDRAFLLGQPCIWDSQWVTVPASVICAGNVAHCPYTTGLWVKWVAFFWAHCIGLGAGDISCVESLLLYELWAGERLVLEKARAGKSVDMGSPLGLGRASEPFFNELLSLFRYPSGSARALLAGFFFLQMTHSEKSHIRRMKAWPNRQECRGHDPTKKNLLNC